MLKYEKVPERSKNRLKLKDIGYQGLIACLSDIPSSMLLFRCLSEQVLGAGTTYPAKSRLALATHPEHVPWGHHWWLPMRLSWSWGWGALVAFGDRRRCPTTILSLLVCRPSQLQGPGGRGLPVPPG